MDLEGAGKIIALGGVFLVTFGLLLVLWQRIPLPGRLPGDILWQKGSFQFIFPVVTCIVTSIVLTVILNLVVRLFK